MRVLLLSAYDAESHKRWRKGLAAAFPDWHWTVLTLPPRYFSWRIRGNSLSWAMGPERATLEQPYDLLIVTSMTDLSALRGLAPALTRLPTLVYFHENQFAYPKTGRAHQSVEPQILNLYTALCGDRVVFNSEFNRRTFLQGAAALLDKLPDCVPPQVIEHVTTRSLVMPVPLEQALFDSSHDMEEKSDCLVITWAARWEYDKGGDRLLRILQGLEASGVEYRLNLLGQSFRKVPSELIEIQDRFMHRLLRVGFIDSLADYRKVLAHSDVFLSTAYHEFQGLAVMEATALGAIPLVPHSMAYPEIYPVSCLYDSEAAAVQRLQELQSIRQRGGTLEPVPIAHYGWNNWREPYENAMRSVCGL
ncbi:tRNA-queuosine alpha-mannosyltransferase domain-containing protein [Microbulbifer agarilyticus]